MTRRAAPWLPRLATGLLIAVSAALAALPAAAQTVRVAAGEHPGFTRVVLSAARPFDWTTERTGADLTVVLGGRGAVNLAQAFARIDRRRLAALSLSDRRLTLHLGCDCEAAIWQERPGLLVIDLRDPEPEPGTTAPPPAPAAGATATSPGPAPTGAIARDAGAGLARSLAAMEAARTPLPVDPALHQDAVASLSARIAQALGEGLLESALPGGAATALPPASAPGAPPLPAPFHVSGPATAAAPRDAPPAGGRCAMAPAFDFLFAAGDADFASAFAPLVRDWIGEFDRPDPEVTLALAQLFLRSGFGAEARAVIDAAPAPLEGRVLLLGLADLLEDRPSNARLQLALQAGCGDTADLLAALAGAEAAQVRANATGIVLAWMQFPAPLRLILGPDLARRLIESDAVESGRVLTDALRRLTDPPPPEVAVLEALAERARGDLERAAARLDSAPAGEPAAVLARLELALARGETLGEAMLADAVALAASMPESASAPAILAAVTRHHLRALDVAAAFALIDRIASRRPWTPTTAALVGALADEAWRTLAEVPDLALLTLLLSRPDWQTEARDPQTRAALADRLRPLGLTAEADLLDGGGRGAGPAGPQVGEAGIGRTQAEGAPGQDTPPQIAPNVAQGPAGRPAAPTPPAAPSGAPSAEGRGPAPPLPGPDGIARAAQPPPGPAGRGDGIAQPGATAPALPPPAPPALRTAASGAAGGAAGGLAGGAADSAARGAHGGTDAGMGAGPAGPAPGEPAPRPPEPPPGPLARAAGLLAESSMLRQSLNDLLTPAAHESLPGR